MWLNDDDDDGDSFATPSLRHDIVQQPGCRQGLPNLGRTCYLNVTCHLLFSCSVFGNAIETCLLDDGTSPLPVLLNTPAVATMSFAERHEVDEVIG